jgi:hypothetical protein
MTNKESCVFVVAAAATVATLCATKTKQPPISSTGGIIAVHSQSIVLCYTQSIERK